MLGKELLHSLVGPLSSFSAKLIPADVGHEITNTILSQLSCTLVVGGERSGCAMGNRFKKYL